MRCCKKAPQGRGVGSNRTTEPQPAKVDVAYDAIRRLLYSYGRVPGQHLREQDLGSVSRVPTEREKVHANRPSKIRIRKDAHGTGALRLCRPPPGRACTNRNCRPSGLVAYAIEELLLLSDPSARLRFADEATLPSKQRPQRDCDNAGSFANPIHGRLQALIRRWRALQRACKSDLSPKVDK